MKTQSNLEEQSFAVGKIFLRTHLSGFLSRKPKKVMAHTNQVLRFYRDNNLDLFDRLFGTILVWRYIMMAKIPKRESLKLEKAIMRSFNYNLNKLSYKQLEEVKYLCKDTPKRSLVGWWGNPLRELLELKIIEFSVQNEVSEPDKKNLLENEWHVRYTQLTKRFRLRTPFLEVLRI